MYFEKNTRGGFDVYFASSLWIVRVNSKLGLFLVFGVLKSLQILKSVLDKILVSKITLGCFFSH